MKSLTRSLWAAPVLAVLATGCVVKQKEVVAVTPTRNADCWVKVYDDGGFDSDDSFATLVGPVELTSLTSVEGKDWANQSLIVGPRAEVTVWKDVAYGGNHVTYKANQRIDQLGENDLSDEIESIKITCTP
jgi:hypothetical protein